MTRVETAAAMQVDEHRALVHSGSAENRRVHEHDVDHREERGDCRDELPFDVGAVRTQTKITINKAARG